MGRFFKQLQPYIPLLVFLLPVMIGLLGRLAKSLSNQAKKRQEEQDRLQREMDSMRTGVVVTGPMGNRDASDDLDASRRASLAASDKRRMDRGPGGTIRIQEGGSVTGGMAGQGQRAPMFQPRALPRQQIKTRAVVPVRGATLQQPPARPKANVAATPIPTTGAAQRRRELQQRLERQRAAQLSQVVGQTAAQAALRPLAGGAERSAPQTARIAPPAPTTTRSTALPRFSNAELRRVLVMREIFERPVSERDE